MGLGGGVGAELTELKRRLIFRLISGINYLLGGGQAMWARLAWVFSCASLCACDDLAKSQLQSIQDQVAKDAVDQYEIAARQGDPIQKCVQAGMVSAAYLQAKDETNYQTWKAREKLDCSVAGLPQGSTAE